MLSTRLTEKLGCKYPSCRLPWAGWQTRTWWRAVATRGFGFLAGPPSRRRKWSGIYCRVKELTGAPFGVNFHMYQPNAEAIVDMVIPPRGAGSELFAFSRTADDSQAERRRGHLHADGGPARHALKAGAGR